MTVNVGGRREDLSVLRTAWIDALKKGSLFQFNPFFYAFAKKQTAHMDEFLSRQT